MTDTGFIPLFGDLHNHCGISYGHGELRDALKNAALRLDFVSITGHADWPDMDTNDPRIEHIVDFHVKGFARLKSLWEGHLRELSSFESSHPLITYPGYEIHSNEHGDYTIVGREHDLGLVLADSPPELRQRFTEAFGTTEAPPVLLFPHHLGYHPGARGVNWDSYSSEFSPVVEIYSMHGLAENDRSDKPSLHSMGPFQEYGTVNHAFAQGLRFGVLGNTDHHSGHPGGYGHGMTGVWADSRERDALWQAIYDRRTWAMTGDAVRLWFAVDETPMGGSVSGGLENKPVRIEVGATNAIDYVELVVDGTRRELWWEPEAGRTGDEAIVAVELGWGERGIPVSWDVTLQVDGAEVVERIPRFRGPEVVSPLDKKGETIPTNHASWTKAGASRVDFQAMSWGNMTNSTPSTQGFAVRIDSAETAEVGVTINGTVERHSVSELLAGSRSGNLGPIDSPAYLLSAVSEREYSRSLTTKMPADGNPQWAYVRVRLKNGHWAISSPVFGS